MTDLITWVLVGLLFAAAVAVAYVAVVRLARALMGPRRRLEEELGEDALRRRLERGQIDREEFEQARRALGR